MHLRIFHSNGICIESGEYKFMLDPSRVIKRRDVMVGISHAHSDHLRPHTSPVFLTPETAEFFVAPSERQHKLKYGEHLELGDTRISVHNANHILGSAQFLMENNGVAVYTGDFKLGESLLFGKCDVPQCDTLIIESTYGHPQFRFPAPAELYDDIEKWAQQRLRSDNVLFGAYALGKSQELIRLLNQFDVTPLVHPRIAGFSEVYDANNVSLEFMSTDSPDASDTMREPFVAIVPPRLMSPTFFSAVKKQTRRRCSTALTTGWGLLYSFRKQGIDRVFPFSDHCDFYQLLAYVEQSNARRVYTVHGYEHELAHEITRRLNIEARPLAHSQTALTDF
jgi:Cft2 family RNA processing exonuclease